MTIDVSGRTSPSLQLTRAAAPTGRDRDKGASASPAAAGATHAGAPRLSLPHVMAGGIAAGATLGALALRTGGAGWSLPAFGTGAWKGAALGAAIAGALLGLDALTDGAVKNQLDLVTLDRRAQLLLVLRNPTKPWLAPMSIDVARDARAAQHRVFGAAERLDGPQDAFRHAYAAALLSLRAMREHDVSSSDAHALAIDAGNAHERDGQDNNDEHSRSMDVTNNEAVVTIVGDGRARAGEAHDGHGFLTDQALRERVLGAIGRGELTVVDRTGAEPTARPTTATDLP